MMPSQSVVLIALLAACSSPQWPKNTTTAVAGGKAPSAAGPKPSGPKPTWVGREAFTANSAEGIRVFGDGEILIEESALISCWDPRLMVQAAENRGRAAIAKLIAGDQKGEVAIAELGRSDAKLGWYDGDRTIHVLVAAPLEPTTQTAAAPDVAAPTEGVTPEGLIEHLRAANRARLHVAGLCDDPYQRSELTCCGPINTFCADQKRIDKREADGTCGCGEGPPCLHDFQCQLRNGAQRCICQGPKCPCDVLTCDAGETCGDGRCY